MPTLVNGCGTWYCGKRRIHRVKARCSQCGAFVELDSYDTTLCFVILMIPIVPLSQKRILESCPACRQHRVVKLKDWEASKAKSFNSILEKLRANPDDRETIQVSLGLATAYQDEKLFDKLADVLAGQRTQDPEIQAQIGSAYEYFSRWSDAEGAYSRSLNVDPRDDTRERLAVCLLKQNRPEEAAGHVRHVFDSKDPDKAWLVFWLVEGFMARGMHEQALTVMDARDQMYPDLAKSKVYRKQRQTAEKNRATGKPIHSAYLAESAKTGFREGSRLGFKWPKYVALAIFLGLIALYLGVALYRGENQRVYLVNGWTKPYTVKINGEAHQLQPGAAKKIDVSEGKVSVDWPEGGDGEQKVTIETSFWSRPFKRPVFVINPDRTAFLEWDETVYADKPIDPEHSQEFRAGKILHEFKEVDYEFEPFPAQIQAKRGSQITKTRVGLVQIAATAGDRIFRAISLLQPGEVPAYLKRLVQLDPTDAVALAVLSSTLPPAEAIEFLRTRLSDRPIRVEWHRRYQHLMEVTQPAKDLRPEYRKLIEETQHSADAVYLLARLEDGPESDKLCEEAASANPPSVMACAGLSFRCVSRGDFDQAVSWAAKAHDLAPADAMCQQYYVDALLAAGKWPQLLKATQPQPGSWLSRYLPARLTALVATGEHAAAEAEISRATPRGAGQLTPAEAQLTAQLRLTFELMLAEVKRDRAKYLELSAQLATRDQFTESLLRGDYKSAAAASEPTAPIPINLSRNWEQEATRVGLLYLAGAKAKDAAFAETQWTRFAEALGRGDRDARNVSAVANGPKPLDLTTVRNATIQPSLKRIILAALARKFPEHAKQLDSLAAKLDFERDKVSLCLRYLTE
jgi:tetratricopeptide (TPR) repeat protein